MRKKSIRHKLIIPTLIVLGAAALLFLFCGHIRKTRVFMPDNKAEIETVLQNYVPAHSEVKSFNIGDLEIRDEFAKAIIVPLDTQTDNAFVILKEESGNWKVIWGPGTSGYSSEIENLPPGL